MQTRNRVAAGVGYSEGESASAVGCQRSLSRNVSLIQQFGELGRAWASAGDDRFMAAPRFIRGVNTSAHIVYIARSPRRRNRSRHTNESRRTLEPVFEE